MSAVHNPIESYVLGNTLQEQERLKLQGRFLEKWTEQFLVPAGLAPGMNVLDLGCGMGDVSLLAARLVGPTGRVTGIDRDPVVIEKARERARDEGGGSEIELIQAELLNFRSDKKFDAVVGRYVLFFQPDPVTAIIHAAKQVRPNGIIVFHEMDLANRIRSYPDGTLFGKVYALIAETDRLGGVQTDLGLHLTRLFLDAGLPWPTLKAEVPVGGEPGSFIYRWFVETIRSLLPRIEQFGLATADELRLDTLLSRMEAEAVNLKAQLIGPLQFGAWTRNLHYSR
ncbi:MAG TPA: class I SAM-dependent methyltransferase [Bryobacteraceae bacterium]|jgi:ubiquinone/menaquinone biosynthesis C-methylase UbiE|nr:class I SAM-dependent methyltransferase [Bryobacteraceae bacterium]